MANQNPFDAQLSRLTGEMQKFDGYLEGLTRDTRPFDSTELSDEEEALMYAHPSTLFDGEINEQTGMPYSDAEAAQRLLDEMGPVEYVRWVEGLEKRRTREGGRK